MVRSIRLPILGAIVAGLSLSSFSPKVQAALADNPTPSAEPNSFNEVTAQLDPGGSFYLYLSTEQWLSNLAEQLQLVEKLGGINVKLDDGAAQKAPQPEQLQHAFDVGIDLVKKCGLQEITGVGASSIAIEPGLYRNKFFVHHAKDKGDGFLWSIFGKTAHPLDSLDLLPLKTGFAMSFDLDPKQILTVVREQIDRYGDPAVKLGFEQVLAQVAIATGAQLDDFLASTDGSIGLLLTLDPAKPVTVPTTPNPTSIPGPQLAIFLKVKNDLIFRQIDKTLPPDAAGTVNGDDLRMRVMPAMPPAMTLGIDVKVAFAQTKDYLIIASNEDLVHDMVNARATKAGFRTTPEFAKLAEGLPKEGNAYQLMTELFAKTLQAQSLKNIPSTNDPTQDALLKQFLSNNGAGASYAVSTALNNGWLAVGKAYKGSPQFTALAIAPALLVGSITAPMVIAGALNAKGDATNDVKIEAPQNSKQAESANHERQIGLAVLSYASDHGGKFPPNLQALVPNYLHDAKVFVSPFAPDVAVGYTYHPHLTEGSPAATVVLEDDHSGKEHFQILLHRDGSVETKPPM